MPLVLTEEQSMLRDSARGLISDKAPVAHLRQLRDGKDTDGFSRALWKTFAEMGFAGLLVPEAFGGSGLGCVEAGVVIGERVRLDANVFVGRGTTIANDSHLYPGVVIYHGCRVGERAIIHSGAVIGSDGFGFAPDFTGDGDARTGTWVKIPQVGGVSIGPDVEIGANTTIDRGAMADTVIDECVKIDNLVQIGHNCRVGAYTVIAGCAGIAGSTTIGRHCMIGGAVGIAGHVTLADYVIVTAKSGVSKSLLKPGMYTSAFPAIDHGDWNRSAALMRNLDKLRDRIKALEAAVAAKPSQRDV